MAHITARRCKKIDNTHWHADVVFSGGTEIQFPVLGVSDAEPTSVVFPGLPHKNLCFSVLTILTRFESFCFFKFETELSVPPNFLLP